jgi:hypothetical protein
MSSQSRSSSNSGKTSDEFRDEGANRPIPSFDASSIRLTTIAPALGVPDDNTPDYLDYDTVKGRGFVVTMFANTGVSYLLGTLSGGVYGLGEGLRNTPSNRFKVKVNSVLNHCSRHGSRIGNMAGCLSVFYSFYEYLGDTVSSYLQSCLNDGTYLSRERRVPFFVICMLVYFLRFVYAAR